MLIKFSDIFRKLKFMIYPDIRIQTKNTEIGHVDGMKAAVQLVGVREGEQRGDSC